MIKTNLAAFFVLFLLTAAVWPQARVTRSFDKDWLFYKEDPARSLIVVIPPESVGFDDSGWRRLDVPHDWSIEGPFEKDNPTGWAGGFLPSGVAWYRKHFRVPAEWLGMLVFIEFEGVMSNSQVWINGKLLGGRPYGYVSFSFEMSEHLNFGGENSLAVRVDTSKQPASRWYTGAGIYRHVRLVAKDPVHLVQWGTFVTTPTVSERAATVKISSEVVNTSGRAQDVTLDVTLYDPSGRRIGNAITRPMIVPAGETKVLKTEMTVRNPDRWHIGHGALYKTIVRVIGGRSVDAEEFPAKTQRRKGKIAAVRTLDDETVSFGIREFRFEPATGFWLNGKNFKIKGMCLHHDGSAFGAAVPLAVWEHRLAELRKLGVNAIRNSHNPEGNFLDLADRMGFLVMDELFDQWTRAKNPYDYHLYFAEWSKRDVRDTVRRDRNHPSVIMYSAGNEIRDNHHDPEKAKQTLRGLVDTFHENDPTRPVTQALFRPNIEGARDYHNGLADMLDVVGQNYREKEILAAYKQNPKRKIIGTENDRQSLDQWLAMRDHPEYSGQFVWAGIDYLGESRAWPNYAFTFGMLDRTVTKRPLGWQRQSWWSDKPMVYLARRVAPVQASPTDPGWDPNEQTRTQNVFGDWTPKNLGPHDENVEVYSNCDEVELFLNGKSLGVKSKLANDSPRNWIVPFEPGTIRAACISKSVINTGPFYELRTAGKPAAIKLTAHKSRISNDWEDVVFVTAEVIDANGVLVPSANDLIRFDAVGSGFIAAVDCADNADHDPFQAKQRKAFQGRNVALVKANRSGGRINITAGAAGLKGGKITVEVDR